jgi:hypothetical protein
MYLYFERSQSALFTLTPTLSQWERELKEIATNNRSKYMLLSVIFKWLHVLRYLLELMTWNFRINWLKI